MPKQKRNRTPLTAAKVKAERRPGWHSDGIKTPGFFLVVAPGGSKSWAQRIMYNGKHMGVGLGPVREVTLADARNAAQENRLRVRKGEPPVSYRQGHSRGAAPKGERFADFVEATISLQGISDKQADTWRRRLDNHAGNILPLSVSAVSTQNVLDAVQPHWPKPTGKYLLQHIIKVLAHAKGLGKRNDNPGETAKAMLPVNGHKTEHHAAMPHAQIGGFLAALQDRPKTPAAKPALRFVALTACRISEALEAQWADIDLEAALWTQAGNKQRRTHKVPLSAQAIALLRKAHADTGGKGFVFPGKGGRQMSDDTVRRMMPKDADLHGFRSGFDDWATESGFDRHIVEICLGHAVANQTTKAYARSKLLERRRPVMQQWADHLAC